MKGVFLGCLLSLSALVNAQTTIYQANYSQYHEFDYEIKEYVLKGSEWEKTRFAYSDEWFKIELEPEKTTKIWWIIYDTTDAGVECYVTEKDAFKICLDFEKNKVNIFSDSKDGYFSSVWTLTKISKL
ncbi:MAG: hypothetical protein P8N43_00130 [Alphaproteobacteria bacterium]|nr:hypothetical protein [Alphaproteobacteria bacterium]